MKEPREPIHHNNKNFDIDLKKAILDEALSEFNMRVLADDMLFRAISTTLRNGEPATEGGPDLRTNFSATPNMKDGKYSLCLEESARGYAGDIESNSGDVGSAFFKFATMKYVPVCAIETKVNGDQGVVVDRPFVELALGRDISTEEPRKNEIAAIEAAVRTVLGGVNEIADYCEQRGVEIVSDGFGRPQLLEEAQRTFYAPE